MKRVSLNLFLSLVLLVFAGCNSSPKDKSETTISKEKDDEKPIVIDEDKELSIDFTNEETKYLYGSLNKKTVRAMEGERVTDVNKYPWMVALTKKNGYQFCDGVLISPKWVLTAAHCLIDDKNSRNREKTNLLAGDMSVVLGRFGGSMSEVVVNVKSSNPHKNYKPLSLSETKEALVAMYNSSDIGLLELENPVSFEPITLVPDSFNISDKNVIALGKGKVNRFNDAQDENVLQQISLPTVSNEECSKSLSKSWNNSYKFEKGVDIVIDDNMLCAGFDDDEKDSVSGNSGGPLVVQNGDNLQLVGVTSYGSQANDSYGVYTKVSSFREFISSFGAKIDGEQLEQKGILDLKPFIMTGWLEPIAVTNEQCAESNCTGSKQHNLNAPLFLSLAMQGIGKQVDDSIKGMKISIYNNDILLRHLPIDSLAQKLSQWSLLNIKLNDFPLGKHTIKIEIDSDNIVLESNETNNKFSYTFTIRDETKTEGYYMERLYNDSPDFFGSKVGDIYDCYGDGSWICQNFMGGKIISISTVDLALEWQDTKWIAFTYADEAYSDTEENENADVYIDHFYNETKSYFGEKVGKVYTCFNHWRCQSFSSGKRISVNKQTFMLEWEDVRWEWHEFGSGSQLYEE